MSKQALRDSFRAAALALSNEKPAPLVIEGLPDCFQRQATADDVLAAADILDGLKKAHGDEVPRAAHVAIRAAQVTCDESGAALYDAKSLADIQLLCALPWDVLTKLAGAADEKKS